MFVIYMSYPISFIEWGLSSRFHQPKVGQAGNLSRPELKYELPLFEEEKSKHICMTNVSS